MKWPEFVGSVPTQARAVAHSPPPACIDTPVAGGTLAGVRDRAAAQVGRLAAGSHCRPCPSRHLPTHWGQKEPARPDHELMGKSIFALCSLWELKQRALGLGQDLGFQSTQQMGVGASWVLGARHEEGLVSVPIPRIVQSVP